MSAPSPDRRTPLDYGVQIRFIKDLHDTGGGGARSAGKSGAGAHKYGVAVRVQGIAGQPYVVLKEGEKGDSYGVQLRSGSPQAYGSLPRRREDGGAPGSLAGEGGGSALRRARSHGSLLEGEAAGDFSEPLGRPPGDGRSGSYGTLDGGVGIGGERERGSVEPRPPPESRGGRGSWGGPPQAGVNGSLGGEGGLQRGNYAPTEPFPVPPPPISYVQDPPQAVDRNSLAPINRLISRFDGSAPAGPAGPARGRSGAGGRMNSEEHKRSRSVDIGDRAPDAPVAPPLPSSISNPYSSPPSSSASSYSSLGRGPGSVARVAALSAPSSASDWSAGSYVAREPLPVSQTETQVTPDLLLMDQGQGSEVMTEEERTKQAVYNILRLGANENESATKQKVNLVFEKIQGLRTSEGASEAWRAEKRDLERRLAELQSALSVERKGSSSADLKLKAELEDCLDENLQLQEQLDKKKNEMHQTHTELTQLRMDRESAESRVRQLEDQLSGLQEELKKESESRAQSDSLQADLMSARAELAEAAMLRQRQEDALRQRERELTALKGALKDEVATHDREIEALREQYSQDMERLRSSMEQVSQSQQHIEAERQRVNSSMRSMQQQLEDCREEGGHWREQFQSTREELRSTKQQLLQTRLEKEDFEEELKELQEKVNVMKEQIPDPKETSALTQEMQTCLADLKLAQSALDKLRVDFDKRGLEIISLKKSNQEREAELKYETDRLKGQSRRDKEELAKAQEKVKQLPAPTVVQELQEELLQARREAQRHQEAQGCAEQELQAHKERLAAAQAELQALREAQQELQDSGARLREKAARLEASLQSSASQSQEAEQVLEEQNRSLRLQLEEARRSSARLGQEQEELARRLEEREREKEAARRSLNELEEQKRLLDRALDKANKEMEQLSSESRQSAQALQAQLEEQRERSKRELQEAQRHGKERQAEQERAQASLRTLQEEVSRLKKELLACTEERDNAQLDKDMLTNRVKNLEGELESQRGSQSDRSREIRGLEDKVKHLELELDEERNSVELLTDRMTRSRDQIDQLRSELMQEKSSKQDLELDKIALERQMKELRSRLADMEGQSRSSTGVSQLESKVQELEERLRNEEREKNGMLAGQRRAERKLKELSITLDEERQQHTDQRDQLALRVKALKRQVDEGEGEMERLEGLRRKAVRDMEEQLEQKEALQARLTSLEAELKRKVQQSRRPALDSSALSSEEDDDEDGFYDPSSITSILTESHLQTSSC
ncbi:LOW QUALITY PROTEIN: cingulin [Anguilla anguilla]|uniref:LOW QUALITY PROTEIN: cingulin n=1 Tax=Anguilla anguilla TaxID=7936 RepID=UPI0015B2EAF4|nr:LOW QUALITY PROTEIN: cingulin [Anguilla anguilla]